MKRIASAAAICAALALAACGEQPEEASAPMGEDHAADGHSPAPAPGSDLGGGMLMTPADPGGETADGFTFHTVPGVTHIVRLPIPEGGQPWIAQSTGEPSVRPLAVRTETGPAGETFQIAEYETMSAGNAAITLVRHETEMPDSPAVETRTVNFMVH
jgi:uncharacterized protein involved in copper resistance